MKNLKKKLFLFLSIFLVLLLSSMLCCYAHEDGEGDGGGVSDEIRVGSIVFGKSSAKICVGTTTTCLNLVSSVTFKPSNATYKKLSWHSNDTSVLSVSSSTVSAKKTGKVTLTAITTNGKKATCTVTVADHTLKNAKTYNDDNYHWENGSCGRCGKTLSRVNKSSHMFREEAGYQCNAESHWRKATCATCGFEKYIENPQSHTLGTNAKYQFTNDYHYQTGTCGVCGYKIEKQNQQKHTYVNGRCKCGKNENINESKPYDDEKVVSISFGKSIVTMCVNETENCYNLVGRVNGAGDYTINWSSSKSSVLTINSSGYATALAVGSAKLIAEVDGKTASCTVNVVNNHVLTNITYGYDDNFHWQNSICSRCGKNFGDAAKLNKESHVFNESYLTTHGKHCKVSVCKTCQFEPINTNWISHSFVNGKCTVCGEKTSAGFEKDNVYICKGERVKCDELVSSIFVNGQRVDVKPKWSISNSNVLSLDGDYVTGLMVGYSILSGNIDGLTAKCTVNVREHNWVSETKMDNNYHWKNSRCSYCKEEKAYINKEKHSFNANGKCTCGKTISTQNETSTIQICINQKLACEDLIDISNMHDVEIVWSSSDNSVLKIDGSSLIGIKKGKATLTATAGEKTVKCNIKVVDHKFSSKYECEENYHWKVDVCSECSERGSASEKEEHVIKGGKCKCGMYALCIGIEATFLPSDRTISKKDLKWLSSDNNVLRVDGEVATAIKEGYVILTVTKDNETVAVFNIKVVEHVLANGSKYGSDETWHWQNGTCEICSQKITDFEKEKHKFVDGKCVCGKTSQDETVLPKSISFSHKSSLICLESTATVTCQVAVGLNVEPKEAENSITWKSSDTSILDIKNGDTLVAKKKGKVKLTATTPNGLTYSIDVEVITGHKVIEKTKYKYDAEYHWQVQMCSLCLEDVITSDKEKHTFTDGKCVCGMESKEEQKQEQKQEETTQYTDVQKSDWYEESVSYVTENKLMNGVGENEFSPNSSMTRAMLVTVLYRMSKNNYKGNSTFIDVKESEYYSSAVAWASKNEIVNGIGNNEFAPNAEVTREQLIVILYRYAKYAKMGAKVDKNSNLSNFEDYEDISEYSLTAFEWGYGKKIISGRTETTLNPKGTASRAEVATMLMRFESEK